MRRNPIQHGIGLIEVVIGASIILIGVLALVTSYNTYVKYALVNDRNVQAALLLEEGFEGVKFLRDYGWTSQIAPLTASTTYYLSWNGSRYVATTTASMIDATFKRTFVMGVVYRDSNSDIASSGSLDSNTKKVTVSVAYKTSSGTTTRSASTYITNLFAN